MKKNIYSREEFVTKIEISPNVLVEWERLRLIKPVGVTDDHVPFYSEDIVKEGLHIRKLLELGYGLDEIRKIVKKVGLPSGSGARVKEASENFITVGALAEQVGVSPRTIKHWEDKGIIEPEMRSEGGFRLYPEIYVYFCNLIKDLQLFGYSLEEIKIISDYFREFLKIQSDINAYPQDDTARRLDEMLKAIQLLFEKINLLKQGIQRWEDLVRKKKKEILNLKNQNGKRPVTPKGETYE